MKAPFSTTLFVAVLLASVGGEFRADAEALIAPKVLVIATYETGNDRGDVPGELQYWVKRENLDQAIQVPGIDHPVLTNGTSALLRDRDKYRDHVP